jgi:hypothetical protein
LPNSPDKQKISVSYTRLERKVPFGTGGVYAGLRNLITLPSNNQRPRLSSLAGHPVNPDNALLQPIAAVLYVLFSQRAVKHRPSGR